MPHEAEPAPREISRGVVAIYKDYMGRGPTDAHTEITGNAAITRVCGSLTKAEQSLVADGRANVVREMRRNFQDAMGSEMTALVEAATGREAECFLSDHDTESDLAIEVVLFKARTDGANPA
jgi:uncharacterized protein YbcI